MDQTRENEKYAIIQTGGKQYRVAIGECINVELLDAEPNKKVEFGEVLFLFDGSHTKVGAPHVSGAFVHGEVLGETKGKKISTLKYKASHFYCRQWGHRQRYTRVKITGIGSQEAKKK